MSESFELKIPETINVPQESIIKVIAKTLRDTLHPDDPEHKQRVFEENELMMASRSLALKPIGLNHMENIPEAIVVNADWNVKDKVVEALLSLPQKFIELVRKKEITKVSVDYIWDHVEKSEGKSIFRGLKFLGLSLLHGLNPGDPGANILFEGESGRETLEITVRGEPFAGYADFADCVAKNQNKEDPEAYCGAIKAQVEAGKSLEEIKAMIESGEIVCKFKVTLAEAQEIEKLKKEVEDKDKRIGELETAVTTATQATEALKTTRDKDVQDAKDLATKEVKKEFVSEFQKIIPSPMWERTLRPGAKRFVEDVKKIVRKVGTDGA